MDAKNTIEKFNQVVDNYLQRLDEFSISQIKQKPNENSWSIGQVYIHLWMATKGFFFKKIEECYTENSNQNKHKNLMGFIVLLFKKIPTIKIKMPKSVAVQPREPESKEYIIEKLNELKTQFATLANKIEKEKNTAKAYHPLMGFLSAEEWLKLSVIHFQHHEKQINNTKKTLKF